MTSTTHPEFDQKTEALEVAQKFPEKIRGKTILITGVNLKGVGFPTAQAFVSTLHRYLKITHELTKINQASQYPSTLIIAGRSPPKMQESIDALKAEFPNVDYRALKLDLSSQRGVRQGAAELLSWKDIPSIDILVNNAAIMNLPERTLNEDGHEMQFATNYIGHFLFTSLVMPKLIKAAEEKPKGATRIINVTSLSPTRVGMRWSDLKFEKINKDLPNEEQPHYDQHKLFGAINPEEKSYLPLEGYNQSKVGNLLFTIASNKRLYEKYGILSLAVHPGVIVTELSRDAGPDTIAAVANILKSPHVFVKTLGAGAATSLVAATDPKLGLPAMNSKTSQENYGTYLIDCQVSDQADPRAISSSEAERMWKLSEELVKEQFAW